LLYGELNRYLHYRHKQENIQSVFYFFMGYILPLNQNLLTNGQFPLQAHGTFILKTAVTHAQSWGWLRDSKACGNESKN